MKVNNRTNFLIFYTKQAITLAETVLNSLKSKLVHQLSNFQNDALKNLFVCEMEYCTAFKCSGRTSILCWKRHNPILHGVFDQRYFRRGAKMLPYLTAKPKAI